MATTPSVEIKNPIDVLQNQQTQKTDFVPAYEQVVRRIAQLSPKMKGDATLSPQELVEFDESCRALKKVQERVHEMQVKVVSAPKNTFFYKFRALFNDVAVQSKNWLQKLIYAVKTYYSHKIVTLEDASVIEDLDAKIQSLRPHLSNFGITYSDNQYTFAGVERSHTNLPVAQVFKSFQQQNIENMMQSSHLPQNVTAGDAVELARSVGFGKIIDEQSPVFLQQDTTWDTVTKTAGQVANFLSQAVVGAGKKFYQVAGNLFPWVIAKKQEEPVASSSSSSSTPSVSEVKNREAEINMILKAQLGKRLYERAQVRSESAMKLKSDLCLKNEGWMASEDTSSFGVDSFQAKQLMVQANGDLVVQTIAWNNSKLSVLSEEKVRIAFDEQDKAHLVREKDGGSISIQAAEVYATKTERLKEAANKTIDANLQSLAELEHLKVGNGSKGALERKIDELNRWVYDDLVGEHKPLSSFYAVYQDGGAMYLGNVNVINGQYNLVPQKISHEQTFFKIGAESKGGIDDLKKSLGELSNKASDVLAKAEKMKQTVQSLCSKAGDDAVGSQSVDKVSAICKYIPTMVLAKPYYCFSKQQKSLGIFAPQITLLKPGEQGAELISYNLQIDAGGTISLPLDLATALGLSSEGSYNVENLQKAVAEKCKGTIENVMRQIVLEQPLSRLGSEIPTFDENLLHEWVDTCRKRIGKEHKTPPLWFVGREVVGQQCPLPFVYVYSDTKQTAFVKHPLVCIEGKIYTDGMTTKYDNFDALKTSFGLGGGTQEIFLRPEAPSGQFMDESYYNK